MKKMNKVWKGRVRRVRKSARGSESFPCCPRDSGTDQANNLGQVRANQSRQIVCHRQNTRGKPAGRGDHQGHVEGLKNG
jgi:hypothetical protein